MEIYEFQLAGFDSSTDETDHLIKWVACPPTKLGDVARMLRSLWTIDNVRPLDHVTYEDEKKFGGIDVIFTEDAFKL